MTKQEAAKALGMSERTLERYTQQNRISVRYEKGKTRTKPVYEESDVRAFKELLFQPTFRPAPMSQSVTVPAPAEPASDSAASSKAISLREDFLVKFADSFSGVRIAEKPVLKLAEARKLTGIPLGRLKQAIEGGRLKAQLDGPWGRGYRLRRSDLDAFIAAEF